MSTLHWGSASSGMIVKRVRSIAVCMSLCQTALLAWTAHVTSPVLDELPHLAAGISHWEFGTFDLYRVNPPLVRMIAALPAMGAGVEADWMGGWSDDPFSRPEFPLGRRLVAVNAERTFWLFTFARWGCIPFAWLGGWVCFRWARDLYGEHAGLTALALWCTCPNVLAWGATICPDLPAASVGIWAAYSFCRWLREPSWPSLLIAILSSGLALLTKSTWIILFGLWPALWGLWRLLRPKAVAADPDTPNTAHETSARRTKTAPSLAALTLLLAGALYVVHVGYGFSGTGRPLGEFQFISRSLTGHEELGEIGNRFQGTWLAAVPSPLPSDYLRGIDVQRYEFETGKWSYLRGEQKFGGWWWYYLYALAVKTPCGTLVLLGCALLTCFVSCRSAKFRDEIVLLLPGLAVLALVSSQTGFNRYLRYVLPVLPGLYIWMSRVVSDRGDTHPRRRSIVLTVVCLLAAALSSLSAFPHSMTYFHELAGGPTGGHQHLLDANLDWGQELLTLRDWVQQHPEAQPLFVTDFGWVPPQLAGIESRPVPRLHLHGDGRLIDGDPDALKPGWYVVSVNHVLGYRHYDSDRPVYTWLREFEPIARPGHVNWVFRLTAADVAAFRLRHSQRDTVTPK